MSRVNVEVVRNINDAVRRQFYLLFIHSVVYEMQGTRKSWQSGQDKMLCTDIPH